MGLSSRITDQYLLAFGKNWVWFLLWGIAIAVLGLFAISATALTTLITVITLGLLLVLGGVVVIFDAFTFWRGKGSGFYLHVLMGILYLLAGSILIKNPLAGSVSITLLLGIAYIILGLFRVIYSLSMQMLRWGWSLFNGIITLLLGILIMANWPASSLFIIGLFVGIDLVFCGWAYIMVAIAARNFVSR
ncbi:hypothetical protein AQUSIP_10590 [Aquicella siphonis]|uniref:Acid-resistance membrane protein n=1 Tax=Aquicella siphonis TaxID=254247 RepID=A0A5E4PGQ2_9COXI|nr:DUF308 domain-containing protein [Aquicella siphonis]VVC75765.1 hypothetical protein AQUSIP_10590 [Aquicella siphonis]